MNPRTWVPKASTLPLDHRRHYEYIFININNKVVLTVKNTSHCNKQHDGMSLRFKKKLEIFAVTFTVFVKRAVTPHIFFLFLHVLPEGSPSDLNVYYTKFNVYDD